jgi:rhodanese-related sulfurtransferase
LNGAVNISIDSISHHLKDLKPYKDRTILVYCSHSQRSRVVSKFLTDSGFRNVYSLNGGMTEVNRTPNAAFPCKSTLYTSNLPYKLTGPDDAVGFIKDKKNLVLDVRSIAEFNGTDTLESNNIGRIKNALNIPKTTLDSQIPTLTKYKDRPILVCALYTDDAMTAAAKLTTAGFKNVSVLFDGLDSFLINFPSSSKTRKELVTAAPAYRIIGVRETVDLVNKSSEIVIADLRPKEQFENKSKQNFYNLGHIQNAVNFTDPAQLEEYLKGKPKTTPILLYGSFSAAMRGMNGMTAMNLSAISKKLTTEGYTNVYLLYDGIYSVVWSSANVESLKDAGSILTDHKGLY